MITLSNFAQNDRNMSTLEFHGLDAKSLRKYLFVAFPIAVIVLSLLARFIPVVWCFLTC